MGEAGQNARPPHSQQADAALGCDVLQHPRRQKGKVGNRESTGGAWCRPDPKDLNLLPKISDAVMLQISRS